MGPPPAVWAGSHNVEEIQNIIYINFLTFQPHPAPHTPMQNIFKSNEDISGDILQAWETGTQVMSYLLTAHKVLHNSAKDVFSMPEDHVACSGFY